MLKFNSLKLNAFLAVLTYQLNLVAMCKLSVISDEIYESNGWGKKL
jgi:hypothetical protein